ncbi:hypothetical protein TRIATDRAFT_297710 [Trichoderma atroviride IMI 206040]|uniref:Uncharacterized protein n=1 Tax=Hypocrea atroviridis (strain ATCC 20476 / IMI 206040) TaxID=452589 RepID=G9NJ81_HYPAI|nr:uncharacterized protein TRIATDRAFT_297710 [Trichoderma atroviride IMI 206040]EHK48956.1 hypothetical protein TRIATDRAFT_297710 [Trichoderma atroviride IMI 206040]
MQRLIWVQPSVQSTTCSPIPVLNIQYICSQILPPPSMKIFKEKKKIFSIDAQAVHLLAKPCPSSIALICRRGKQRFDVISFPTDLPRAPCRLSSSAATQGCSACGWWTQRWTLVPGRRHRPLRRQCSASALSNRRC